MRTDRIKKAVESLCKTLDDLHDEGYVHDEYSELLKGLLEMGDALLNFNTPELDPKPFVFNDRGIEHRRNSTPRE